MEGGDPVREAARLHGDRPALAAGGRTWTWRELDGLVDDIAARLIASGVEPGHRVAGLLPRSPEAVVALHAVPRAGAALAPMRSGWTAAELALHLAAVEPRLLVCRPDTADTARRALETMGSRHRGDAAAGRSSSPIPARLLELAGAERDPPAASEVEASTHEPAPDEAAVPGLAEPRDGDRPPADARPGDDHAILATSGSSGRPRPVRLTLANHLASAGAVAERLELGPEDRWLATLSLAHVGGMAMAMRAAVTGACLVVEPDLDAAAFRDRVERGRISHVSLVPTMLRRVLDHGSRGGAPLPAPAPLRCVLLGGAAAEPGLVERALAAGYPVFPTYGLTEAASQVATGTPALARRKPGAAGPPLPGVELGIREEEGAGGAVDDEMGEVLVRGDMVSPGVLSGDGDDDGDEGDDGPGLGHGGWLATRDVGRLDGDGVLWILGRLTDRIVTGGVTVHPAEVEAALREHPEVGDAVVVGLQDPEWGQRVAAVVEPSGAGGREVDAVKAGAFESSLYRELEAFCRRRLSSARRPRRLVLVDRLPRTDTDKPDRRACRELLEA